MCSSDLIASARERVVVLGPDLASLRNTRSILQFVGRHTGSKRAITLLNRNGLPGGLALPLIEKGLEQKPDFIIPDYGRMMLRAFNLGKPAIQTSRTFQRAIAPVVQELSGTQMEAGSKSLLNRLLGR